LSWRVQIQIAEASLGLRTAQLPTESLCRKKERVVTSTVKSDATQESPCGNSAWAPPAPRVCECT
jgi:hypothetical protein